MQEGKKRLAGETARAANTDEVKDLRREACDLKEVVAEQTLELRLLKKACSRVGATTNEVGCSLPGRLKIPPHGTLQVMWVNAFGSLGISSNSSPMPACLVGVQAQCNIATTATAGIGAQRAGEDGRNEPPRPEGYGPGGMPPGFEEAAVTLGVTPDALLEAMDAAGGRNADLSVVATRLGLTEDALRAAILGCLTA